jgi:hypothetical protein
MRIAIARAVSVLGHPIVLVSVAALTAASTQGAPLMQLRIIGVFLLTFAGVVFGFMWFQVRAGRWTHVDASARSERPSLNLFLVGLLVLSAVLLRYLLRSPHMSIALVLAAMLVVAALLLARWVKVSLHTAFAAYSTALLWPLTLAVVGGIVVTAAVAWSRLALGRHVAADVGVGFLLGVVAGTTYDLWVV